MDRDGPNAELREVAERLLGPSIIDPSQEEFKVNEILSFMVEDRKCGDPAAILNMMSRLDKQAVVSFPKKPMVDRVWLLVKQLKAKQAVGEALSAEFQ